MKVLMIISNPPYDRVYGGAETFVRDVGEGLAKRGHEIHLLTEKRNKEFPDEEIINGVVVHRYSFLNLPKVRALTNPKGMYKAGEKIIKKYKIDIVNPHITYPSGYVGLKLGERFNIPVLVCSHEIAEKFIKQELNNIYIKSKVRYVFSNANIHVVSNYSKEILKKYFPNKKKYLYFISRI